MLNICHSNSVDVLLQHLAATLQNQPPASPFDREIIIAPSPAMARWINIRLCQSHGIAANIDYPLPSSFIWKLARTVLTDIPEKDPLSINGMTWKAFRLLPELINETPFTNIKSYLADDVNGIKRWQLSSIIADTFDRYQLYRPDIIRQWSEVRVNPDDITNNKTTISWQRILWQHFVNEVSHYRVASIDKLLQHLSTADKLPFPERVNFFAAPALSPLIMEVIHALSKHLEFNLYLHSPTPEFWADLKSQKAIARKRLQAPEQAEYWENGNALLASWGRQGQAIQDLLLLNDAPLDEVDIFIPPQSKNLLGQIHSDIYQLSSEYKNNAQADDSIQVHICHSPQREVQVLHDQLLFLMDKKPDLRPEDILVMVPEINSYAPYIEAVFHHDEEGLRPYIPWILSDLSMQDEHPLIKIFLQLLCLADSRFTYSEVVSYLEVPELARKFKLTEVHIEQIKRWLLETNVRWGIDARHKIELELPAQNENTWKQAEQRLFGGYALGDVGFFENIAPIETVEGINADVLGYFWHLFSSLTRYHQQLKIKRTPLDWQVLLNNLLDDFFADEQEACNTDTPRRRSRDLFCVQKRRDYERDAS